MGSPAALTPPCVTTAKREARVREENDSSDGAKERKMGGRAR